MSRRQNTQVQTTFIDALTKAGAKGILSSLDQRNFTHITAVLHDILQYIGLGLMTDRISDL